MRVAAIQLTSTPDKSFNLRQARELLLEAKDQGAELVAFPENFLYFAPSSENWLSGAELINGLLVESLCEWAAEYDVWILAGSLPLLPKKNSKKITNTSLFISDLGEISARYDKMHLFDVTVSGDQKYFESELVLAGKKVVTAAHPQCKIGLSICYDIRFPEIYRKHSQSKAEILMIPAAFTATTGKAHWDVLTRARAIENQCFVIAPAQWGSPYPGRETHGHTRIIDPWGRIIAERPQGTGVVIADLDFSLLNKIRQDLPALQHRKI